MKFVGKVVFCVILAVCSIRHSESCSAFNRSLCQVPETNDGGNVIGGEVSPRDKWPWLVALVYKKDDKFFCGGSLISQRCVLTAAHCMQNKNEPELREPSEVKVYLGKWNLSDTTEPNFVLATPAEIIIHHDWNVSDTKWDADIAIVKLADDVTFSSSIQPVCLWTSQMQPDKTNDGGTVVGWGKMEDQIIEHSDVPREAKLAVLPIETCDDNDDLTFIISPRVLCVEKQGSVPCNGDNGGGFFTSQRGKWFLRGITSVSALNVYHECDVRQPAIFTNVEKFTSWIDQVLNGDEQLKCEFNDKADYTCRLQNSFTRKDSKVFQVSGSHDEGRTNGEVLRFWSFYNSKLKFLPINLGRFFPNLEVYEVERSGVDEISRNNFADLPKLKRLQILFCQLRVIPVDCFYDLVNLEVLYLFENQIEAIDSATFIRNTKLRQIVLSHNKIKSVALSTFRNNLELTRIEFSYNLLTSVGPELLTPLQKLQYVDFNDNTCINTLWFNYGNTLTPSQKQEIKETFARQCQ